MQDDWIDGELLRGRDVAAWETFYQANCSRTYRVLYCVTSAEPNVVEELNQDVWLSAIESIATYDNKRGSAGDWILGIARFKGLSYLRKHYRHRLTFVAAPDSLAIEKVASGDASGSDGRADRVACLRACMASLPEKWQFVLAQKYDSGRTVNEIAILSGATPKAIESILSRSRQRLREMFEAMHSSEDEQ